MVTSVVRAEHPSPGLDALHPVGDRRTGDVIGAAGPGQTILAVTVDNWLIDELAALSAGDEDREPEDVL
jgi:hypothetical protein